MDALTLALAKKYTDSQRLGYEENKEIVWDGDTTGKIVLEEVYVRVSEEPIDLSCVNAVTLKTGDSSFTINKEHLTIANIDDGNTIGLFQGDTPLVVTVQKDFFYEEMGSNYYKGTYFIGDNSSFISCVSLSELKTIDPKFLPDSASPKTLDLSTYADADGNNIAHQIIMLVLGGGGVKTGEGGNTSQLFEDAKTDGPLALKFYMGDTAVVISACKMGVDGDISQLSFSAPVYYNNAVMLVHVAISRTTNTDTGEKGVAVHVKVET